MESGTQLYLLSEKMGKWTIGVKGETKKPGR